MLLAALTATTPPHYRAERATHAPVVDGRLDDDAWRAVAGTSAFTQKFPSEGKAPVEATTMRVLYDDDALYVAFDCVQRDAPVIDRLTRRDRLVEADWVEIDLDTRRDGKSAFQFVVNAGGVLFDAARFDDTSAQSDWDENWEAKTVRTKTGWSAEIRIPLRILRFGALPVQSWGMQARRYVSERQETDEWAYIPRKDAGEVSHYGKLDALVGLKPGTPLELRPFALGRLRRRDTANGQLANGTDVNGSLGLDIKWHPTQELTLDATINPDFAQVEADQIVLNLTTFETYYPEKRPFFREGMDVFATPFQLIYTRRIGRAAPSPTLLAGEQLVDVSEPATIYGASKLVGRLADGWTVGTLQAVTARNDVGVQLPSGLRVKRLVEPLSSFNALRMKRDIGANGHIGILATAVTRAEPTGSYPYDATQPQAPQACPIGTMVGTGSRCFNDAYVAAADWRWRSPSGDYVTAGQLGVSQIARGPARAVPDGTIINPGDTGTGGYAYFAKEGGKHWVGGVELGYGGRKFDINDMGFNRRANILGAGAWVEWRELDKWGPLLEVHVNPGVWANDNVDGLSLGRGVNIGSWGGFTNFWKYYAQLHFNTTRFDDREVGDGAALEREGLVGAETGIGSDPTKRVAFGLFSREQKIFDGVNYEGNARLTLRVLPQLDVELLPTWVYTYGEPRFVANGAAPGQYLFGKLEAKSLGLTLRSTYTFTPQLTLQAYAQAFLASGHYSEFSQFQSASVGSRPSIRTRDLTPSAGPATNPDFQEGVLNVNVVMRWEYRLGSLLYVVYTRSQTPTVNLLPGESASLNLTSVSRAPAADVFIVKLSYWWG